MAMREAHVIMYDHHRVRFDLNPVQPRRTPLWQSAQWRKLCIVVRATDVYDNYLRYCVGRGPNDRIKVSFNAWFLATRIDGKHRNDPRYRALMGERHAYLIGVQ